MRKFIAPLTAALVVLGSAVALLSGHPVPVTPAHASTCTFGAVGAPFDLTDHEIPTGTINTASCTVPWYVVGSIQREKSGTWATYSPVHDGFISGTAQNCGNGSANLDDAYACPSGAAPGGPNFASGAVKDLQGATWTYSQNIVAANYKVKYTFVNSSTGNNICSVTEYWNGPPYQSSTC